MQFFLVTALASSALATNFAILPRELQIRQDQSFVPPTDLTSACRSGEFECPGEFEGTKYCSDPSLGDTCCKQGYNCPGGSFCLIDGYCCPDGLDASSCARQNGVTLPADFGTSSVAPVTTSAPATAPTTAVLVSTTTPPYVVSSNSTVPVGTATGTGSTPGQTSLTPFTGAASVNSVGPKGALAVIGAGVVAALF